MNFTASQQRAIETPGSVLVVAGAGAGKTGALVERFIQMVVREANPVPIRRILAVTFTEAAAAEARERIHRRLEEEATADPGRDWLHAQLADLDRAHIRTLHGFCLELVRQNFYELDLDPALAVLAAEQAKLLAEETLEELLNEHYAGQHDFSKELQQVIRARFQGWDQPLREFVRKLHEFTQTRPDPESWFERQQAGLENDTCADAELWLAAAIREWRGDWLPHLRRLPPENTNAQACAEILEQGGEDLGTVARILARDAENYWPKKKKTTHRKQFAKFFEEAAFLGSLAPAPGAGETPLAEDWKWMRGSLLALLKLARQFSARFSAAKRERGAVDFHDLEQGALRLLWNAADGRPTTLACRWQERFEAVFVDEYQDINAAQDQIITALSREGERGNRFLVGDIKQSIYRFRQADPSIFRRYLGEASGWSRVALADNFRSHEAILDFVNPFFCWLMRGELGGVPYDEEAWLLFGAPEARGPMREPAPGGAPRVELHLLVAEKEEQATDQEENGDEETGETGPELDKVEQEARRVASRLRELRDNRCEIFDEKLKEQRRIEWSDMAVLVSVAAGKLDAYARMFAALGVPLRARRGLFYTTPEVLDLCSLLHVLDNPLQDIPLLAVLRSPIGGFSAADLARVRLGAGQVSFWAALNQFREEAAGAGTGEKVRRFLAAMRKWRQARGCSSLAERLEAILADTGYAEWLLAQPGGGQRRANVRQLVRIARQFDESRGESLYLFLRHLQELQDAAGDIEPALAAGENAVRLMTIHQSKGLEFPVVAVAGLGGKFNEADLRQGILLDEELGICGMVQPPDAPQSYPSLPLWLARRRQKKEMTGEQMRLLYVALTRAQHHLLLFGSAAEKRLERWVEQAAGEAAELEILRAGSLLDWLGMFAARGREKVFNGGGAAAAGFAVRIHQGDPANFAVPEAVEARTPPAAEALSSLAARIGMAYPHLDATRLPAKASVTALRRLRQEADGETAVFERRFQPAGGSADGVDKGTAIHAFLEHFALDGPLTGASLRGQAEEFLRRGLLKPAQAGLIDFGKIAAFWNSPFGQELLARKSEIRRELSFTCRLAGADLAEAGLPDLLSLPGDEFIVLQGTVDLAWIGREEIWLVDFKSDALGLDEAEAAERRYRPQIELYALALSRIYRRKVALRAIYFLEIGKLEML